MCPCRLVYAPYGRFNPSSNKTYHNAHKQPRIAFKLVTSLCPFYRTQNLFYIISVISCRCAFYAVYSPHLQAMIHPLVYSYANSINTLKMKNIRLL